MKFHIKTYGCQMNVRDSEAIASLLVKHGHIPAEGEQDADILLVNTCSVREKSEDKAIGKLGMMTAERKVASGQIIGAVGCMVQRIESDIFGEVPMLDFAVGPQRLAMLPKIIDIVAAGGGPIIDTSDEPCDSEAMSLHLPGQISAFVNILHGCNMNCTYCIVPTVRGRERSRPGPEIISEIRELAANGVREVTLLGQTVMSYGHSNPVWSDDHVSPLGFKQAFSRLLEQVAAIEGIERIRFTSGHPIGCTAEVARAMAELPQVCEHLHLPMQSASDRILSLMKRGYTYDRYRFVVDRLRKACPDIAISTDIIVGYPSETEEEFQATKQAMNDLGFDHAFVFKYSPRPGTVAAEMTDNVSMAEKIRRNKLLLDDQTRRTIDINNALIGQTLNVLVDGPSATNPARWSARTRGNKVVLFDHPESVQRGELIDVTIGRMTPQALYGTVVAGHREAVAV